MDSTLLKNFLVLADTKNFTKAAKRLHRSQSAISLQIARLEEIVGKPLFLRDNRNVLLTKEGEELLGYAHRILRAEEEMLDHFHADPVIGEVTFGTPEDLATAFLPNILGNFVKTHPGIFLNVHCEFTLDLLKGMDAQAYDLILIKQDPRNPHPRSEEVWKEPLVWAAGKNAPHFQLEKGPLPLVLSPSPCVYRQRAIDALNREGVRWRIVYTSPSIAGTIAAVRAGLGVSVYPLQMISDELSIVRTLPPLKDTQIALVQKPNPTEAVRELAKYVARQIVSQIRL